MRQSAVVLLAASAAVAVAVAAPPISLIATSVPRRRINKRPGRHDTLDALRRVHGARASVRHMTSHRLSKPQRSNFRSAAAS